MHHRPVFLVIALITAMAGACGAPHASYEQTSLAPSHSPSTSSLFTSGESGEHHPTPTLDTKGNTMNIDINGHCFTVNLAENSSAEELRRLVSSSPVTIDMKDYAAQEKVGMLPFSLPRNDEQIHARPGDLVLYQGNQLVIYYTSNSWSLTRLGRIEGISVQKLREILAPHQVTVSLSYGQICGSRPQ